MKVFANINGRIFTVKLIFLLIFFDCICNYALSQGRIWFAEMGVGISNEQKSEYTGGSSKKSPAYTYFVNFNNGGRRLAIGVGGDYTSVGLQNVNNSTYKKNSLHLWEFYFALRYYPLIPTMRFGTKGAIRFTAGGQIGFYDFYWREKDNYNYPTYSHRSWSSPAFSSSVFAGLCFSPFRNTSGLSLKLNYRPQTYSMNNFPLVNFTLKQTFSLSVSLFIGPRIKS